MLTLGRRIGETILIGEGPDQVAVTVVRITRDGQVRLGITAPKYILVDRMEVRQEKESQRAKDRQASDTDEAGPHSGEWNPNTQQWDEAYHEGHGD